MSTKIRLSASQRSALRGELRKRGVGIGTDLTKAELLAAAEDHHIPIPAPIAGELQAATDIFGDDDLDALELELTETPAPAPSIQETSLAALGELEAKRLISLLATGDVDKLKSEIASLAIEAKTPKIVEKEVIIEKVVDRIVEKTVNPITCKGHVPQVVKHVATAAALGCDASTAGGAIGGGSLEIWDAPDAPDVDKDYIWPPQTGMVVAQMRRGRNIFLSGPRGVGKSTFPEQLAARQCRPFVRLQCHEQTDASTLVGMTVPDNGAVRWQDGALAAAVRRPGTIILIDEPSVARPGALFAFQSVLDAARALVSEETGQRIPVAPGVSFFGADNSRGHGDETGLHAGVRAINSATIDRFGIMVLMSWLPKDEEARAIASRSGCALGLAEYLVRFAHDTRQAAESGKLTGGIGPRRLISWAENITDGFHGEAAFDASVHDMAPPEDREALRQLFRANIQTGELARLARGL